MTSVESYVEVLDRTLVGPRRVRRDLLTEVRDHLSDATEAYLHAGLDPVAAEQRALSDFGTVEEIAPDYQTELGLVQGRRTAGLMLVVLFIQPFLWDDGPIAVSGGAVPPSPFYDAVDAVIEVSGALAMVIAALCAIGCGVGTRYLGFRRQVARGTAVAALVVCAVLPVLALLLSTQPSVGGPSLVTSVLWATALLVLPMGVVARSARRCLAAT
ncbi:MAG: permease prefix domain 1-containing protein [Nocardioidaceae bacterium]